MFGSRKVWTSGLYTNADSSARQMLYQSAVVWDSDRVPELDSDGSASRTAARGAPVTQMEKLRPHRRARLGSVSVDEWAPSVKKVLVQRRAKPALSTSSSGMSWCPFQSTRWT